MTSNNNPTQPVSFDALAVGRSSTNAFLTVFETRNPTSGDINYTIQQRWYNTSLESEWILTGFSIVGEIKTAIWQPISEYMASTETLTGNTGGAVGVDSSNNINILGDGTTVNVAGDPATHTLTISVDTGSVVTETLTGNTGGAVGPASGNINVLGDGTTITIAGDPGTNTLTASATGAIATLYTEDSGTATPSSGNLIVHGAGGITTSGSGHTVTVTAGGTIPTTFTETSGTATPSGNNLNILGGTNISTSGSGSTVTIINTMTSAFLAYCATSYNNVTGDGTEYQVIFETVDFNRGSNYNATTGVYTAPVTGYYQFNATVLGNGVTSSYNYGNIQLVTSDGRAFLSNHENWGVVYYSGIAAAHISLIVNLAANATISVEFTVAGSSKSIAVDGANNQNTFFSGALLGV